MCKDSNDTVAREPYLSTLQRPPHRGALHRRRRGEAPVRPRRGRTGGARLPRRLAPGLVGRFDAVKFGTFERK